MNSKLTMALVSESQEGNVGDEWKYVLEVKVFHHGLQSEKSISVPKHKLSSGAVQAPHGEPRPELLFTGECKGELLVRMRLTATEVDLFINDTGSADRDVVLECPGPGGSTVTKEVDIAAGVRESPGILPKNAVFKLRVRFTMEAA